MVTFKKGWDKLYYIQHTLLSNAGQLSILFFFYIETNTHTQGRGKETNTKAHHNSTKKIMVTFKGGWDKLYYTQFYKLFFSTHVTVNNILPLRIYYKNVVYITFL